MGVLLKLYQAVLFYVLWAISDLTLFDFCKMFQGRGVKRLKVPL
jgi:hypothetical protein